MKEIFESSFKFQINEDVRHRGDTKSYTADMGLLVLKRVVVQTKDDDGNYNYERFYICRMIRFSGSGDLGQFSEQELMSIDEYEDKKTKDDIKRESMLQDAKRVEREVLELFGISKDDYVYLKDENGVVDKNKKYRMTGFNLMGKDIKLTLRESLMTSAQTPDIERQQIDVVSKNQFEKVQVVTP